MLRDYRTLATNCANFYNNTLARCHAPEGWPFKFELITEHVCDAFTILSLLEDCLQHAGTVLRLPHSGLQKDRFSIAMQERNEHICTLGLPDVLHKCDVCTWYYDLQANGMSKSPVHSFSYMPLTHYS